MLRLGMSRATTHLTFTTPMIIRKANGFECWGGVVFPFTVWSTGIHTVGCKQNCFVFIANRHHLIPTDNDTCPTGIGIACVYKFGSAVRSLRLWYACIQPLAEKTHRHTKHT